MLYGATAFAAPLRFRYRLSLVLLLILFYLWHGYKHFCQIFLVVQFEVLYFLKTHFTWFMQLHQSFVSWAFPHRNCFGCILLGFNFRFIRCLAYLLLRIRLFQLYFALININVEIVFDFFLTIWMIIHSIYLHLLSVLTLRTHVKIFVDLRLIISWILITLT